ncbi:MAG: HPF/RaiA family ribosome-associated protein [Acidimicrobiia bacterium]
MSIEDWATVEESLRLCGGLAPGERAGIVEKFGSLDSRLRSFNAGTVELELTVKERDAASQRTTLEAWIAGEQRLVATSTERELELALGEVRDDLVRQITKARDRDEPRNNPGRRSPD